ncbi:MAG: transcription termination/antitermination factor NusG [Erysipelotrichaceae bacterium]|nr:transcription termination/antitermination factor NusG [Erysipelotrichaceae bacterium]
MENLDREMQWYVVNSYSGRENIVKVNLERRTKSMDLEEYIGRVLVAEIEVDAMRQGKPTGKTKMKNLYPGYVFIEMIMTDEAWYMVRNTPDVTGFVGSSGGGTKPFPVPREQIEPILKRLGEIDESMYDRYNDGDSVKVIHGAFEGTEGIIQSINKETGEVIIEATFFGRPTTFEVDFGEIEKV